MDPFDIDNQITKLDWEEFSAWHLVRLPSPEDGHCLFHSICNAYLPSYHERRIGNRYISRKDYVIQLRRDLANKLDEPVKEDDPDGDKYYDILANGNLAQFANGVQEFSLKSMKKSLLSNDNIGYGFLEFISMVLKKDIYILDEHRKSVYRFVSGEEKFLYLGRPSIVLLFNSKNEHFELVGLKNGTKIITHFKPENHFISYLRSKYGLILPSSFEVASGDENVTVSEFGVTYSSDSDSEEEVRYEMDEEGTIRVENQYSPSEKEILLEGQVEATEDFN